MEGFMKRIILGFLFVFMFCGSVYSMDWSGTYKLIDTRDYWNGGEIKVTKDGKNYKIIDFGLFEILGNGRSPGFCLENEKGIDSNNSLEIFEGNKPVFKLVKNGKFFNLIPVYKIGDRVSWCGPGSGSNITDDVESTKNIGKLRWKKVK